MKIKVEKKQLKLLDVDSECRPMHYSEWRPESQVTAIAWSWMDKKTVSCELLNIDGSNEKYMFTKFLEAYDEADVIVGHYIRKHDLPLFNDHCIRLGLPPLKPKLTIDTKSDFTAIKGLGISQENLSTVFDLKAAKHHMSGHEWREANKLNVDGAKLTQKRVTSDVIQNKELYEIMRERKLLSKPKVWRPDKNSN
jgi:hypothetical protein